MAYEYSDPTRENDRWSLPNVEIFGPEQEGECTNCTTGAMYWEQNQDCDCCLGGVVEPTGEKGFYYTFGFPGCLRDSEPIGPFDSYEKALAAAREE